MKSLFNSRNEKREKVIVAAPEPEKEEDKELSLSKSPESNSRLLSKPSAMFNSLFSDKEKEKEKKEKFVIEKPTAEQAETVKIDAVKLRMTELNLPLPPDHVIRNIFKTPTAGRDIDRTARYLEAQHMALKGIIKPYNPNVAMKGAKNRNGVTCYLDALLFAMFAKLEAFEFMLKDDPVNENKQQLAIIIRTWVNILRSGSLVEVDLVQMLQQCLKQCGWEAGELQQQDTSEAFAFITESLALPLLRLQVDLYHQGKKDEGDHKFVEERLVNVAVPELENGQSVRLEDCLAEYFNSNVEIQRQLEGEKEGPNASEPMVSDSSEDSKEASFGDAIMEPNPESPRVPRAQSDLAISPISPDSECSTPVVKRSQTLPLKESSGLRPVARTRSLSLFQRVRVGEDGRMGSMSKMALSSVPDEDQSNFTNVMTMPAWQVFRWMPWYSKNKEAPNSDAELIQNFNQRPVIGICLKRYKMTEDGQICKISTEVDIPDSLRLPHIITDDEGDNDDSLQAGYKLVLQSVVSHRGHRFDEGHYVSFARVAPKLLTENRREEHEADPPPDYEEPQWVKFDDLSEPKVVPVADLKEGLKQETPYLLFYQIIPLMDGNNASTPEPPSYTDSRPSSSYVDVQPSTPRPETKGAGDRISVSIGRVPTLPVEAMPNSPRPALDPSHLLPSEGLTRPERQEYFSTFYEMPPVSAPLPNTTSIATTGPVSQQPSQHPSPRASGDSNRPRVSYDENEKSTRNSAQYGESPRPVTSTQPFDNQQPERTAGGRTAFGRAVARFSRSASRHSRSSSHSVVPNEEASNSGPFSETRKSISLSNLTRGLTGKESREPLPKTGEENTVPGPEVSTHVEDSLINEMNRASLEQATVGTTIDEVPKGHAENYSEGIGSSHVIQLDSTGTREATSDAEGGNGEGETEGQTSKRRRRRGKKKAENEDGPDPERQCHIM